MRSPKLFSKPKDLMWVRAETFGGKFARGSLFTFVVGRTKRAIHLGRHDIERTKGQHGAEATPTSVTSRAFSQLIE
jgi:hypothetical protein